MDKADARAQLGGKTILEAFGVDEQTKRACSFAFSSRVAPSSWRAFTFDLPIAFYYVLAPGGNITQVRSLALGIRAENYALLAESKDRVVLVLRRSKKDDNVPLLVPLRKEEDYERVVTAVRKFNFVSDELTAHSSINSVVDLLRAGAERYFINRGLFSNHFLKERLDGCLSERGRNPAKESVGLLAKFKGEFPSGPESAARVLQALGYSVEILSRPGYPEYALRSNGVALDVVCVVAPVESLDTRTGDKVAPSYQAVVALKRCNWVVLTNGRLWRLYSGKVSSVSTNYFEIDLESVAAETDPRIVYFVSLFSASSFLPKQGVTDLDLVFEGGLKYARDVEADLRAKVFDGQLFLDFVRGVLDHSSSRVYTQGELDEAKALGLKLLYRLLFVLYAESRGLLPVENERYTEFSLESLRTRLSAFEKQPDATSVWDILRLLFRTIGDGDPEANMPQYDGALFEEDPALDGISIRNEFLVSALRDLMEVEGRGIDYQNLGVRHLGSLYEALLEYSVRQAGQALVVYKDEILDAQYAVDLKKKPIGFVDQGELYLSVKGLARKRTGSYYTPDEIVNFLVRKGLEPHFEAREEKFEADLELLHASKTPDPELERKCTEHLLGLRVVDPAMGSGHFLVTAVDEIARWIIGLLKENPDAPLVKEIEEFRRSIIEEQRNKRIKLDEDLLTDNVILKRMVMKRCVYGVDVNPLAVELAKVSLWLDSFTIGTPLTFLDHHIRCGDSLIGLWIENIAPKAFETTLDSWIGTVSTAGDSLFKAVSVPPDVTVEQVTQSREAYDAVREKTKPVRVLLDTGCAGVIDPELDAKLPRNLPLVEQTFRQGEDEKPKWWAFVEDALRLAGRYRFFHWELEFPDAFTKERRGFDLIVMNPPWEAVKPEDDDFFSVYYPRFRRIRSKPEKRKLMKELLKDRAISKAYDEYRLSIEERLRFFKSEQYVRRGSGDTNYWKLFLERVLNLAGEGGSFALVIPSGIVTDKGGKQLREALFKGRIRAIFEFENRRGIFPDVHRSYKFVLLVADKTTPTGSFPAAFYLHDIEALEGKTEQDKFVDISLGLIRKCAPDSLSIPEVRNKKQLEVFSEIYEKHCLISSREKNWDVILVRELDRTKDSDLFRTDGKGWLLADGKSFHQFMPDYERSIFTVNSAQVLQRMSRIREYNGINRQVHETVRLVFRAIASSTNVRTVIACILPPRTVSDHNVDVVLVEKDNRKLVGSPYYEMIAYLAGIFNSFVFDFLVRTRISIYFSFFIFYQTPVPSKIDEEIAKQIKEISARLSSQDERYEDFASTFRRRPAKINMRERVELTAKLNAFVAKHYGLNREQLEVILQSFEGFEEDKDLVNMKEVKWNDTLTRKFNGEVRKRVLPYFDQLTSEDSEVKTQ